MCFFAAFFNLKPCQTMKGVDVAMPTTRWQKMIFAFITVVITVHLFVFYNLSFVNGLSLAQLEESGVPVFGHACKVWMIVLIEFICAYCLEILVGSPASLKLALKAVGPDEHRPYIVETAIISATVCIMCPAMSFIATWLYNDLSTITFVGFLAAWLKTVMHNFPLAFFSQLFFIQPFVRLVYRQLEKLWTRPAPCAERPSDTGAVPEGSR